MDETTQPDTPAGSTDRIASAVEPLVATPGESLRIQRRRQRWSLIDAATYYHVSIAKYARWELDLDSDVPDKIRIGLLATGERCLLARLRAGICMQQVADDLHHDDIAEIDRMERGEIPAAALLDYLIERGVL